MTASSCVLAIDQGTSGTKSLVFDSKGNICAEATIPLKTSYFGEGFVEQHPEDIYKNVLQSVRACLQQYQSTGASLSAIVSCGISNQRETFLLWDEFGSPLCNAVVWQCKRSVDVCYEMQSLDLGNVIHDKTGLFIDPYFSGTKLIWLYRNNPEIQKAIKAGKAYFGTVDTWLLYRLTKGEAYLTDYTNASRTLLFNLNTLSWDRELIALFGLEGIRLPEVKPSSYAFGSSHFEGLFKRALPVQAMIGDSHAAAFGEACIYPGTAKATLGTGCSILFNVGTERRNSNSGMVSTICWSTEDRVDYALEGIIVSCASPLAWLKTELGLLTDFAEAENMATSVTDNNGVYLIPAFSGLGAPFWDMNRKASLEGLTFSSNKNHIVRAALESIAYQIQDVLSAMKQDTGIPIQELMVNGGASSNNFVVQFLSDLLEAKVIRNENKNVSAFGAGFLAGLKANIFPDLDSVQSLYHRHPIAKTTQVAKVAEAYRGWQRFIHATKS
ncbi:MAG: glycerol kinase GlpK [Pseudosphingobacterium sp.]|nr:glycerol kinase GlpK [Olivibacter sp. UJ_SKK_5.1]MDX3916594.1 glycerol kinase GlpK [Pseudosphingobacterium sp.]